MAHRALTLKYRPQVFADMVGQDHVSRVLAAALESGRIAHAYLFTGARGVGKTTAARILAKALNCERRASGALAGADPCNQCTSCAEITSGVALDVTEIDGASNRGIADVQALREKVRFTPTGGKYRVVIIDEVHQLSNDAFAALLKTLEEPPPHLVFIFATTDPQKLPDTIRSRTQRYDFARVPLRKVADRLLDIQKREAADADGVHFTLTEGAALLMAHKSEGSMRDAVSALDQVVSSGEPKVDEALVRRVLGIADREVFFSLADAIVKRDPKDALRALHEGFEKGIDPREMAEGVVEHVRHILILKVDPDGADLVAASSEDLKRLRAEGEGWSENDLLRLLRIASEVSFPMRDSPQPLVHLEAAILQMSTLEPGETLAQLLQRLEALERRLGGSSGEGSSGGGTRSASAAAPKPAAPSPMPATRTSPPARPDSGARSLLSGMPRANPAEARAATPTPVRPASALPMPRAATPTLIGPAPVAPAPRAATGVGLEDAPLVRDAEAERAWTEVVARMNQRKRLLGAFLEESVFLGRAGGSLVIAMDDLHRAVIDEKENRVLLGEEVRRVFGEALAIQSAPLEAAREAGRMPSAEETRAMVEKALDWFGGEAVTTPQRSDERTIR